MVDDQDDIFVYIYSIVATAISIIVSFTQYQFNHYYHNLMLKDHL